MSLKGVSNIIYGMGLMGADWHTMGDSYTEAASEAVVASFGVAVQRRGGSGGGGSAQAVANVIYSLGTLRYIFYIQNDNFGLKYIF